MNYPSILFNHGFDLCPIKLHLEFPIELYGQRIFYQGFLKTIIADVLTKLRFSSFHQGKIALKSESAK